MPQRSKFKQENFIFESGVRKDEKIRKKKNILLL